MNERQTKIRRFILASANDQFQYGKLDCVQFAMRSVEAITGTNPAKKFNYRSEDEAQSIIESFGSITAMVSSELGATSEVSELKDGDPVVVSLPVIGEVMGIFIKGLAMVKTEKGTINVQSSRITTGWCV